jgi:hypothetical protein
VFRYIQFYEYICYPGLPCIRSFLPGFNRNFFLSQSNIKGIRDFLKRECRNAINGECHPQKDEYLCQGLNVLCCLIYPRKIKEATDEKICEHDSIDRFPEPDVSAFSCTRPGIREAFQKSGCRIASKHKKFSGSVS